MTYRERIMQLKEEISAAKTQYTAFNSEITRRASGGEEINDISKEREAVFRHCNSLLDEYHRLLRYLKDNHLGSKQQMPDSDTA